MKKIVLILSLVAVFCMVGCANKASNLSEANSEVKNEMTKEEKKDEEKEGVKMVKPKIEISVKDYGVMQFELDPENAPITVENFIKLTKGKFYDGLTFHRNIAGFMIQGGDPDGNGTGGSKERIKGEFTMNGVQNKISHVRGVISMARSGDPNSASSQFFICHQDATFLDGQYAAFGKCISGIEVVDKICDTVQVEDQNGGTLPENQPVIEYIKVIE